MADNRSLVERIAQYIPMYRGYKQKNLRRDEDRAVRDAVARSLGVTKNNLANAARSTVGNRDAMRDMERVRSKVDRYYVDIKKAVNGYSAFHDSVKITEAELDAVVSWDAKLVDDAESLNSMTDAMAAETFESGEIGAMLKQIEAVVDRLINDYHERENVMRGFVEREQIGRTEVAPQNAAEPQFEGQTKTKLGNTEAKSFVQKVLNDRLGDWFERNPSEGKDIIRKSQAAALARIAARKARDMARNRKGLLGGGGLPGKLVDCQSRNPGDCEVFIVEGDSAGGSARGGRDPKTQAILPIRGKILNVEKARLDKILANKEVEAIINALGTGIQEDFDLDKLRYHKIVLMADADVDGAHIRTLLLTLLFRFMRPLIDAGHVYLAQPPLFRLRWTNAPHELAYSDEERDTMRDTGLAEGKKLPNVNPIQRYKGLGEMNADDLWETTMDPAKRILLQVNLQDAAMADQMFSILMGEDVEQRRSFIQHNARDVRFLDI